MMRCAIAGSPGGGKSTLFSRLVAELGRRRGVLVRSNGSSGVRGGGSKGIFTPGSIRCARVAVSRGFMGSKGCDWTIYDAPGLADDVQSSPAERKATAEVIRLLLVCDAIVHVIDASRVGQLGGERGLTEVDSALHDLVHRADWNRLASSNGNGTGGALQQWKGLFRRALAPNGGARRSRRPPDYIMVASKMDLPWAQVGRDELGKRFPDMEVVPLSAGRGEGARLTSWFLGESR